LQKGLDAIRSIVEKYPMIPALKAIIAAYSNEADWKIVRPPLIALGAEQQRSLMDALGALNFEMPGIQANT
jgi:4-hydroxy-tetrahydrodipicolinate synthase